MDDDVFWVAVALADAERLGDSDRDGVVFGLTELGGVVVGACAAVEQPPDGTVVTVCSTAVLCVGLGFGVVVGVGVGVVLGVALPLTLGLELPLGLALPLALALAVTLGVLVTGLLDRAAALVLVTVFDGLDEAAGDDEQVAGTVAVCPADPLTWVAPFPSGWPPPALAEGDGGLCKLRLRSTVLMNWWRSGGTAASTTPTANTARPTASAGRSIASRQSRGRCGAGRAWDGPEPRPLPGNDSAASLVRSAWPRPSRPARKAAIAALRDWMAVAWAGRERIFSRIRSRPSAPGST